MKNLNAKRIELQGSTILINTIASSEVLNKIETSVLQEMHEKKGISSLLTNAESWDLSKAEEEELEKIEIRSIKDLFNLPLQTPTVSIIYTFGTLFTKQRVDKILLLYLHKMLLESEDDMPKQMFKKLHDVDVGWAKKIKTLLEYYDLPTEITEVEKIPPGEWIYKVKVKIEEKNKERLWEECHKTEDGIRKVKTKTSSIVQKLENPAYKRQPDPIIKTMTKQQTRTMIVSRYGMLECGKNWGGSVKKICEKCNCIDSENHRLNDCIIWKHHNLYDNHRKVNFDQIYSDDEQAVKDLMPHIEKLWNVKTGHGSMNSLLSMCLPVGPCLSLSLSL